MDDANQDRARQDARRTDVFQTSPYNARAEPQRDPHDTPGRAVGSSARLYGASRSTIIDTQGGSGPAHAKVMRGARARR